jgi:hypothetical protein
MLFGMSDFAVRCRGCGFTWHSAAMADGLRVLGACPKCKGELEFASNPDAAAPEAAPSPEPAVTADAPHLVLGLPRR